MVGVLLNDTLFMQRGVGTIPHVNSSRVEPYILLFGALERGDYPGHYALQLRVESNSTSDSRIEHNSISVHKTTEQ